MCPHWPDATQRVQNLAHRSCFCAKRKGASSCWREDSALHGLAGERRADFQLHLLPGLGLLVQYANCTALQGSPFWATIVSGTQLALHYNFEEVYGWKWRSFGQILLSTAANYNYHPGVNQWGFEVSCGNGNGWYHLFILDTLGRKSSLLCWDNRHRSRLSWTTGTYDHLKEKGRMDEKSLRSRIYRPWKVAVRGSQEKPLCTVLYIWN